MAQEPALSAQEMADLIDDFINEKGLWYDFKEFVEIKGYKIEELGMEDNVDI